MMLCGKRQIEIPGKARRRALRILPSLFLVGLLAGCDDEAVDRTPPAIPAGVQSITADGQVILRWIPNREPDLASYSVWWNDDGGAEYQEIARFGPTDNLIVPVVEDPSLDYVEFVDAGDDGLGLPNGSENYYAVSAMDFDGNESDLSLEPIRDVPRPEGQVVLEHSGFDPVRAGFNFASGSVVPFNSASADVWFEVVGNVRYLNANPTRVRIQDYGNVGFDVLSVAPEGGWSVAGRVEALVDHTYAIEIESANQVDVNYAKLTILSLVSPDDDIPLRPLADMDWAYQPVTNEWQLKRAQLTERSGTGRVRRGSS